MLRQEAKRRLDKLRAKKKPNQYDVSAHWKPNSQPQTQFVESTCREILYGGAAGGGKSQALTALPLLWAHLPGFLSLTLRREFPQLNDLLDKASELYPKAVPGIRYVGSKRPTYTTPGGARFLYGSCHLAGDYAQFDGWQINLLNFDELTHFTEKQYKYICARVRTARKGYPTFIRATTNPGGEGHDWVFKHWGAWLDPNFEAEGLPKRDERPDGTPPAKPAEVWWIRTYKNGSGTREVYFRSDPGKEPGHPKALSRTFIPAKLSDNRDLCENDPEYEAQLQSLDALRREQLLNGNWLAKPAAGLFFKRAWTLLVEKSDIPRGAVFVRYWDRAATEKTEDNDPDWTVGLLMARFGPTYWIVDRLKGQWSPGKVDNLIKETAELDAKTYGGEVETIVCQDPGQAGKSQAIQTVQALAGYRVGSARESGSKLARFGPFSSQAEHNNVRACRGAWNEDYFARLEEFDGQEKQKDDDADATSGAFAKLAKYRFDNDDAIVRTRRFGEV